MQVRLLGPVDVIVDDAVRPVPGARRKAVLAVLALAVGDLVTTDRLIDVVWGDRPPTTALNSLQAHVSYLRGVLGDRSTILARPPGYVLAHGPAVTDLQVALRLMEQGREASADPTQRVSRLKAALALWRGRSLADVGANGWLDAQAERLENVRLDTVCTLIDARLALGEHASLVGELEHLIGEHPFHEGLHGQLMLALYRSGRQADALATFQRLRCTLGEELGITPGAAARDLEAAILRQDHAIGFAPPPGAEVAIAAGPASAVVPVPRQLPADVSGFAGRTRQLDELDAVLEAARGSTSAATVCAISGTAGLGKTALAVHWSHRIAHRFPDGQLYVNLRGYDPSGSPMRPEDVVRGFLDAFAVPPDRIPASLDAQTALYRGLLADKRVLVVLDNARDAEQVRPLLPSGSSCLVLVTARDQLTGLVAADGAHLLVLGMFTRDEARSLLERRLGRDRVAAEPHAVTDIIDRCARLPLALTVVAARAIANARFPLRALAAELGDARGALDALAGGDAATDVRTVFSWSYDRLGAPAARMFRLLSLHPGSCVAAPAASSLAGVAVKEGRQILGELTRAHLIIEQAPGRHTFHDLLRVYASEQSQIHDPGPTRQEATLRLLDHYLHTAHAAARLMNPLRSTVTPAPPTSGAILEPLVNRDQALHWFATEHRSLLAVLDQAAATGWDTHAWQLAWTLGGFLDWRGHWYEWVSAGRVALVAARRLGDTSAEGLAHRLLVHSYSRLGRLDDAYAHGQSALDLYRRSDDHIGQAHARRDLSRVFELWGQYGDALEHARRALELFRAAGVRDGHATALNSVGWFHALLGDHESALTACEEALRLQQELDDRYGQAATWDSLGYANHHLGRLAKAVTCYRRALDLYQNLGDRFNEADILVHLGETHRAMDEPAAARLVWHLALTILDDLGHPDAERVRARLAGDDPARATTPPEQPRRHPLGARQRVSLPVG